MKQETFSSCNMWSIVTFGLENALYILSDCFTKADSTLFNIGFISFGSTLVSLKKLTSESDCFSLCSILFTRCSLAKPME